MWNKIWKFVEHHRFSFIAPLVAMIIWGYAVGCTPEVASPLSGEKVNASALQVDYDTMQAKFKLAVVDLQSQAEANAAFTEMILKLASGSVASWGGLLQLFVGGGLLGVIADNLRKNGVIAGLK